MQKMRYQVWILWQKQPALAWFLLFYCPSTKDDYVLSTVLTRRKSARLWVSMFLCVCVFLSHITLICIFAFVWFTCVHQICSASQYVCICMRKEYEQCSLLAQHRSGFWFAFVIIARAKHLNFISHLSSLNIMCEY